MIQSLKFIKVLIVAALFVANNAHAEQGVSVTLKADAHSVYINAELIVTVELKTALPLRNGSLGRPEIKDAVIETLVEDEQKEIFENGVAQKIYRRVYAIFPAKPGKLIISPVAFEGIVVRESNGFFPGFFSNGQRISTHSNALLVTVKDVPASFPKGQSFLPLKRLEIVDAFDEPDPKFEVNKATTQRFEIKALGNLASSIPPINPPRVKGIQIYAEAGEKIQSGSDKGISANISLAHVYLPYEPGPAHIPEQKIYWWDTTTDQLKTVIIKPLDIVVEGTAQAQAPSASLPKTEKPEQSAPEEIREVAKADSSSRLLWPILAAIFFILWILTFIWLIIILGSARRAARILTDQEESRFKKLWRKAKENCNQKDGKQALRSLSSFYRTALQEGIKKSTAQDLSSCLSNLEDALYRHPNEERVQDALRQSNKVLTDINGSKSPKVGLEPLYRI